MPVPRHRVNVLGRPPEPKTRNGVLVVSHTKEDHDSRTTVKGPSQRRRRR
eukprot:m.474236 g.474236  ORF g.474236 m.474236 type:complete len:50 (-) comp35930_c0_seq1:104-253(-)